MKESGKEMKPPPHSVNLAQRETTHNCLLQTLEVLLGLFMSLVQKSGGEEGNARVPQDYLSSLSPPSPFLWSILYCYLFCKLPTFSVQKLEKKKKDEFHKKHIILLLTDQTAIDILVSVFLDSYFYAGTSHKNFMGSYHSTCFVACFSHLTEYHKDLSRLGQLIFNRGHF